MVRELAEQLDGRERKIGIVVAEFNRFITERLLHSAMEALQEHNVKEDDVTVVWVPGSFEIPLITQILARSKRFDGIICLGAVIKGETAHFEHVANEAASGIRTVCLQEEIPVGFGILTTYNSQQAIDRVDGTKGDSGYSAALTVLRMINIVAELRKDG